MRKIFICCLLMSLCVFSCSKQKEYPDDPDYNIALGIQSLTINGTSLRVTNGVLLDNNTSNNIALTGMTYVKSLKKTTVSYTLLISKEAIPEVSLESNIRDVVIKKSHPANDPASIIISVSRQGFQEQVVYELRFVRISDF